MSYLIDVLWTIFDLMLVVLGFSAIIVIHEAGHFVAARWAGIRVLAFAVGFGPALVSYRKGMGLCRGSTEARYNKLKAAGIDSGKNTALAGMSSTEYRLNVLPFGGYVKMLGQDDADPAAVSDEVDSYQRCTTWKRMVVISAGVVANIITAAALFVIVFQVGLKQEPAVIGAVVAGKPASLATPIGGESGQGVGLRSGDRILKINGNVPNHFNDVAVMVAMSRKGEPLEMEVARTVADGKVKELKFSVMPRVDEETGMLSISIGPHVTGTIVSGKRIDDQLAEELVARGLPGVRPGMTLTRVGGKPESSPYALLEAVKGSGGKPIAATFEFLPPSTQSGKVELQVMPQPELQRATVEIEPKSMAFMRHLVGLTPVMAINSVVEGSSAERAGLKQGDVLVQIGSAEWPSLPAGIREIRAQRQRAVRVVVSRLVKNDRGEETMREVDLGKVPVSKDGKIGISTVDTALTSTLVTSWPGTSVSGPTPSGATLPLPRGSRITKVQGASVKTLAEVRAKIVELAPELVRTGGSVELDVQLPAAQSAAAENGQSEGPTDVVKWTLSKAELEGVLALGWESPIEPQAIFTPDSFVWRGSGIGDALGMGLHETQRVMMTTYLTFARLFQGTVKIEHLKGPVGIAHTGVLIADKGFVWLLFFMALISVNLAVINFLPIPIADGGHMVFLLYEQCAGKPAPARVQNIAAIAGLVVLGSLFLVVTFHDVGTALADIRRYFGM